MMHFLAFFGPIGWPELLVILVLVLVIFGPRRLPEISEALGKSIRKFKEASRDATHEVKREFDDARRTIDTDETKQEPRGGAPRP